MFEVKLGATRVIYDLSSNGGGLSVSNPQTYPMLVQSEVLDNMDIRSEQKTSSDFVVTPPLFRLDGGQQSKLRIVRTGGSFATDRESLKLLCVKGIPPEKDDVWADKNRDKRATKSSMLVRAAVQQCIKLIVRPAGLRGMSDDAPRALEWTQEGRSLRVNNPTPFYVNIMSVIVDGLDIKMSYLSPFSTMKYDLPPKILAVHQVKWTAINDYGGETPAFEKLLNKK
ncbi:molecular chaperone [Aeromonas sobria]|uniref:fimbrial biogenesis chaperone n=1 Tax=Aeromonas sobria TaxID=646 RepID=UPI0013969275|nr:fimbria/pilus periplasmic chaperone [Aeromonas sobria]